MEKQSSVVQIEDLKPCLRTDLERFELPSGDTGLYNEKNGTYLRVAEDRAPLLELLDGSRKLSDVATEAAAVLGHRLSIRTLLNTVGELARGGWLENDQTELEGVGFHFPGPSPAIVRAARALLFLRLSSRALARKARDDRKPGGAAGGGRFGWIGLALAGAILAGAAVLLLGGRLELSDDPLWYHGRYSLGLLAVYAGAVLAFSMREMYRSRVLITEGVGVFAGGLALRLFVIAPYVDDRHIFRAGRHGELRLRLAGLAGAALAFGLLLFVAAVLGQSHAAVAHGLVLAASGAAAVLYGTLCPFADSDLGRMIDLRVPEVEGRRHAMSYLQRRILRRIGSRTPFQGELLFILVAALVVVWVHIGFSASASVMQTVLDTVGGLPVREVGLLEQVCVWGVLGATALVALLWLLALGLGILHALFEHRPRRPGKPRGVSTDAERALTALKQFPMFTHLEEEALVNLAKGARLLAYASGKDVVRQGDEGDTFYVIERGEADVIVAADSGLERRVATLGDDDGFGEQALLATERRTATVRAVNGELSVVALERSDFLEALESAGLPHERVTGLLRTTHTFLASNIFGDMAPGPLARVIAHCTREERKPEEVVIREGEAGERFYVIESGKVRVSAQSSGDPLGELGPGDHFGEIALLSDEPRTATVTTSEPSVLLALDREGFREIMTHDFSAAVQLERAASVRTAGRRRP